MHGGRAHLRSGEHEPERQPPHGDPVQLLPRDRVARRPRARRDRALLRDRVRRPAGGLAPHRPGVLPAARRPLGERLHRRAERRRRHPEPVRRQRAGPLRAAPGDHQAGDPERPGRHAGAAAGRPEEAARRGRRAGRRPSPSVSASRGTPTTPPRTAPACRSWRASTTSSPGRRLRRLRRPMAREHPGRERVGSVVDRRRRDDVPALHPASDREPGRQPERRAAGPRRSRRRRTERHGCDQGSRSAA